MTLVDDPPPGGEVDVYPMLPPVAAEKTRTPGFPNSFDCANAEDDAKSATAMIGKTSFFMTENPSERTTAHVDRTGQEIRADPAPALVRAGVRASGTNESPRRRSERWLHSLRRCLRRDREPPPVDSSGQPSRARQRCIDCEGSVHRPGKIRPSRRVNRVPPRVGRYDTCALVITMPTAATSRPSE